MKNRIIQFITQPFMYVILICIICQSLIYVTLPKSKIYRDSASYINGAEEIKILEGKLSESRTPVYPYLIKIIKQVGGEENLLNNIALVQKWLFIITVILFYKCVKIITNNKILLSIVPLIFGVLPCTVSWNVTILTESLALLEMAILSFITLKVLKNPSKAMAAATGIIILIMILTRPIFIYLLPIYLLFWVLKFFLEKNIRKEAIIGIISLIICGTVLLIYCLLMQNQYGEFKLTTISKINDIISVISSNAYQYTNNDEMIKNVNSIIYSKNNLPYSEAAQIITEQLNKEQVEEFITSSKKTEQYLFHILNKIVKLASSNIGINYTDNQVLNNIDELLLPITFGLIYIIMIICIIYLIWKLIKKKKIDWIVAYCTSLIVANLFVIIIGAPFEEGRLFLPSIIPVLLLISYILKNLLSKGEKNEKMAI